MGYSELFYLSKEDLWEALKEYPETEEALLEKGKSFLRNDNMLDESTAEKECFNCEEQVLKFIKFFEGKVSSHAIFLLLKLSFSILQGTYNSRKTVSTTRHSGSLARPDLVCQSEAEQKG